MESSSMISIGLIFTIIGGIIGYMEEDGTINNCENYSQVNGVECVGGIVGNIESNNKIIY